MRSRIIYPLLALLQYRAGVVQTDSRGLAATLSRISARP